MSFLNNVVSTPLSSAVVLVSDILHFIRIRRDGRDCVI